MTLSFLYIAIFVNANKIARCLEATIFEISDQDPFFFLIELDTFPVQLIFPVNFSDTVLSVFVLAVLQIHPNILSKTQVISHWGTHALFKGRNAVD